MRKSLGKALALLVLILLLLLSPLAVQAQSQSTDDNQTGVAKDKTATEVKLLGQSTTMITGQPVKNGGPSPLSLGNYGEGGSSLYSGTCTFWQCAKATSYTLVYDNANYDPQFDSVFYRNGVYKNGSNVQRNFWGDRQDWDSSWSNDTPASWAINTNHKIWQATLLVPVVRGDANTGYSFYY